VGVFIGLISAKYIGGKIDLFITITSAAISAIPNYILAVILLLLKVLFHQERLKSLRFVIG
jgi:ABC-type dipeptide/oligopeptide/nickel transport system permease component